ncbi:MAG: hypothetical protein CL808_01125 [Citromicrobium sp.]|nr:hypothetical protein [Citromicrobium sp.]
MFGVWALASCAAIQPAQMRLPASFTTTEITEFKGFKGWNTGKFEAGRYNGSYQRSEDRLALFETWIARSGKARFAIAGPEISSTIEARCRMRERAIDLGHGMQVTTKPMAYGCAFEANGRPIPARFELQEVTGPGTAAYRYERYGEIALGGEIVQIRSVHDLVGTPNGTLTPIGYLFEQNGRPVGALELNGSPELIVPTGTDPGLRRTITVAALALAVFQDPANSSLDD